MHKTITKSLSFFLALALMLSVFPMNVLAAGHVHNYEVTTVKPDTYEGYDNNQHYIVERHKHLCACGDVFYEYHREKLESHTALAGSRTNLGTIVGEDGKAVTIYRYTCKDCKNTYTRKETRP